MSISLYGRIKENSFDEKDIEECIASFFHIDSQVVKKQKNDKNNIFYFEQLGINGEVDLVFFKEQALRLRIVYGSDALGELYSYKQKVIADVVKDFATIDTYKMIIDFFVYLGSRIESTILVTSDVHDELCLIEHGQIKWENEIIKSWE